jgi:hypothetical protein
VTDNNSDSQVNNAATDGIEHVIDPVYGVMPGGETVNSDFYFSMFGLWRDFF